FVLKTAYHIFLCYAIFRKSSSKKPLKKVPLYIEYFSRAKEDKKRMNGRKSRSFGRYVEKFCDKIVKTTIFKLPASVEFFKNYFLFFPGLSRVKHRQSPAFLKVL
ncbi:MAG: hypothetical protein Q4A45_08395, partial [Clostridia bacterium]|nr:hypothetical protein [Clostridia bacterium]